MTHPSDPVPVTLTEAERDYFRANLRQNLGYRAWVIEDTMLGHVERILADRRAVRFACQTHMCGACAGCKAAGVRDLLSETQARLHAATAARDGLVKALRELRDEWWSEPATASLLSNQAAVRVMHVLDRFTTEED